MAFEKGVACDNCGHEVDCEAAPCGSHYCLNCIQKCKNELAGVEDEDSVCAQCCE